jgi:hypothetical protein
MGQLCSICDSKEEPHKATLFTETMTDDHCNPSSLLVNQQILNSSAKPDFNISHSHSHLENERDAMEENDCQRRLAEYRLEQVELARREAIVTTASQTMVPVGSHNVMLAGQRMTNYQNSSHGGGINTYYDPVYAAAAAQDILRSAAMTGGLVFYADNATQVASNVSMTGSMPLPSCDRSLHDNSKVAIDALGRGVWDGARLGSHGSGLAGCGGEDPEYYLEDLAESFLEKMIPTTTSLVGGCASVVENLP